MRFSIKYYCNVITEKFLFMYRGEIMEFPALVIVK